MRANNSPEQTKITKTLFFQNFKARYLVSGIRYRWYRPIFRYRLAISGIRYHHSRYRLVSHTEKNSKLVSVYPKNVPIPKPW